MKLKNSPENITEHLALAFNLAPTPLVDTQVAFNAARAIMAAAETGIFEALGKEQHTAGDIAARCKTHITATTHLLYCLTGIGYLKWRNNLFSLKPKYYKWLLPEYESNVLAKLRFQLIEWNWMARLEEYIYTGVPLNIHEQLTGSEWALYQQGMRDLSVMAAKELARKLTPPANAQNMLDIGGAHGLYSLELCARHPQLNSTVLELPGALPQSISMVQQHKHGNRVQFQTGNALTGELGSNCVQLVLMNNLAHHFTETENRQLARKVYKALTPGGLFAIGEFIQRAKPGEGGAVAATAGLYFAFTSASGAWSLAQIKDWMQEAGFVHHKTTGLISLPGFKIIIGRKP